MKKTLTVITISALILAFTFLLTCTITQWESIKNGNNGGNTITKLEQKVEQLTNEASDTLKKYNELLAKFNDKEKQLEELEKQLTQANELKSSLEKQLANSEKNKEEIQKQLDEANANITTLNEEKSTLLSQKDELQNQIDSKIAEIANLNNQIEELQNQIESGGITELSKCYDCGGDGAIDDGCYTCAGLGYTNIWVEQDCSNCSGTGKEDCMACSGTGQSGESECPNCSGTGTQDCMICGGTGKEQVTNQEQCTECNGTGVIEDSQPCYTCMGNGTIPTEELFRMMKSAQEQYQEIFSSLDKFYTKITLKTQDDSYSEDVYCLSIGSYYAPDTFNGEPVTEWYYTATRYDGHISEGTYLPGDHVSTRWEYEVTLVPNMVHVAYAKQDTWNTAHSEYVPVNSNPTFELTETCSRCGAEIHYANFIIYDEKTSEEITRIEYEDLANYVIDKSIIIVGLDLKGHLHVEQ